MGYGSFKQYDSRWGKKNYNGSSTMAVAGCGPTSVANLVHAVDSKITPIDTMKYMQSHGYAVRNNGTAWDGIPACMKHFGLTDVRNINVDRSMDEVWGYLAKGYCADFLFRKGSRGGVCWTTAGHYVAVTDYKHKNGKHYFYTRDSGGRNHTGWYCYEDTMRGLIPQIWVGKVGGAKVVPVCIDVSDHQGKIDWSKVKKSGINYAIIRAGYGKGNIDGQWKNNIDGAIKAGIKNIGVYWFSYAYTSEMAKNEADYLVNAVAPYRDKINLGLWYDYEYDSARYAKEHKINVNKAHVMALHRAFCGEIEKKGHKAGFYYNHDYKVNYLDVDSLPYRHWYALYDTSDKQTDCYLQQYSNKGKVSGIKGNVDMDWLFGSEPKKQEDGKLVIDGVLGERTNKAFQKWLGVAQTGILDKITVMEFQERMNIPEDGIWGQHTTKALQRYLNMRNNAGLVVDGKLGGKTISALQMYLNKVI